MTPESNAGQFAPGRQLLRIGIVLATVLALAFVAQATLGPLVASHDRGSSTFEIRVQETKTTGDQTDKSELWVTDLIVDGRLVRGDSLELPLGWEAVAQRGSGLPASLHTTSDQGVRVLDLRGKHLLMVLEPLGWTGVVTVAQNGSEIHSVQLQNSWERTVLEAPGIPRSTGIFLTALMLFAGAAILLGPVRRHRSGLPWVGFALGTLHLLFWLSQCVSTTNDSPTYANSLHQMIRDGLPGYAPPGYPAFLGLVASFSGPALGAWSTLIQHVMAVGAALWIYLLLRRLAPESLAMLGALVAGGLPPVLSMSQSIMSEVPTMFAMVGALYFAVRSVETGRIRYAVLAGLLTGWAGLARVVPMAALLPAICILYFPAANRRSWRLPALAVAVCAAVILLPVSWFWYNTGRAKLTDSTGYHLFNRIVAEQKQIDEDGPATRKLLTLLHGDDPRGLKWWIITGHRGLRDMSGADAERLLREVSLEGIRKDPLAYLAHTPNIALRELFADPVYWIPSWGATISPMHSLETPPLVGLSAASLRLRWAADKVHGALWQWLCVIAIMGLIIGMWLPQRVLVLALAWVVIGYLLSSASVEYFSPRHNVPLIPFVAALAMVPFAVLARRPAFGFLPRMVRNAFGVPGAPVPSSVSGTTAPVKLSRDG